MDAAKAEADRIRLIGEAEAQALKSIGIAEADRMTMKAAVYKKYGEAAILNLVLNAMPKVRFFKIISLSFFLSQKFVQINDRVDFRTADRSRSCCTTCQDGGDRAVGR